MPLTWTSIKTKMQRQARTSNSDVLTQLSEDWNTGYHLFNDKLARYYTREQQFTDLKAGQYIYQTPIDCVRLLGMTAAVTSTYEVPINEVKSELEWRRLVSIKTIASNYITDYIALGSDKYAVWPVPSQNVTKGLRLFYQPQDHDLALDDVTSTSTGFTVTVTNGSQTVTASGSAFNSNMAGWWFQLTGVTDNTWYQILSATNTTLTLKNPFAGVSGSALAFRCGQQSIIPQSYSDAPMHYALGMYFGAEGDEARAQLHLGTEKRPGMFYSMLNDCKTEYSSANEASIITDETDQLTNAWFIPYVQS